MRYLSIAIYESSDEIRMSSFVFCVELSHATYVLSSFAANIWQCCSGATGWPWVVVRQGHVPRCLNVLQASASLCRRNTTLLWNAVPKHRKGESASLLTTCSVSKFRRQIPVEILYTHIIKILSNITLNVSTLPGKTWQYYNCCWFQWHIACETLEFILQDMRLPE